MSSDPTRNDTTSNVAESHVADSKDPPTKKLRATQDLVAPMPDTYKRIWTASNLSEDDLKTAGTLFGSERSWYVRESYVGLYEDIIDDPLHTQIVNGTAGIGKSSFLLYTSARARCAGKCAMLHYHRTKEEASTVLFFPKDGSEPETIAANDSQYLVTFEKWFRLVGEDESVFLVDGIVSFTPLDVEGVKYIVAKSPSCSIGWMDKDQNRLDRWLETWPENELLSYAKKVGILDAEKIIHDNMLHLGGVCRYALVKGAAERAAMNAIAQVGAKELFKVVKTGLAAKYEQQKIVDRLIRRHPPPGLIGMYGTTYTFASEFVATRVAMALCLEMDIETSDLLNALKGVGPAGSMRGVLFEAYAARKISEGGIFCIKEIGSGTETTLDLPPTDILQKDTKTLKKTHYPPNDIIGKLVWPNPDYNMPAIDMFMRLSLLQTCIALQMTVATSHGLDLKGTKAFLKYFDSVMREHFPNQSIPAAYTLYFAVPTDIYDRFSNVPQSITGTHGVALDTPEAATTAQRVKQWVMKIE